MQLQRNATFLDSDASREDKGRRIIIGCINSFTSKSEIGAPLASSYLLDLPDHYKSHEFKTVYWKGFLIAISPVKDYMYRPIEHAGYCMYDWVRLYVKSHKKPGKYPGFVADRKECSLPLGQGVEDTKRYMFLSQHEQSTTHSVCLDNGRIDIVPNFVGGALPRRDSGDREYYCATMLTFFKPWRSGLCLKLPNQSWESAFESHTFAQRQIDIMDNFNLRYECLDARDDYRTQ
ncbi:hypothetical protein EXIGLDRAFT_600391, partial [Exidia glandulosa HHB12029]